MNKSIQIKMCIYHKNSDFSEKNIAHNSNK